MNENAKVQTIFFNGKSIGKSLKEVAVDLIKTEEDDVISRWFHSESDTDLFTWVDLRQNIIKQQLSFHGQIVEWNCLEGIKTGVIIESDLEEDDQPRIKNEKASDLQKSESIQFDGKPLNKSVDLALEILSHIQVEDRFRVQLLSNFRDPENIETMSAHAFMNRFGLALKNQSQKDLSLWEQFRRHWHNIFKKL